MIIRELSSAAPGEWAVATPRRVVASPTVWLANAALTALVLLGLALRVQAALKQPLFIDEPFTLLAIQATATRGYPVLPTGSLYLHGSTLSYLLAPLFSLGWVHPDDLTLLRLVSAIAGAASIFLTYRLALRVGGSRAAALIAATFLALDPASVQWGGYLRMYALAQTFSLCVALCFLLAIDKATATEPATPSYKRACLGLVIAFWLAVFTHLATAMLLPPMILIAAIVFRKGLLGAQKRLTAALLFCLVAPVVLIALTAMTGTGAGTKLADRSEGIPGISFLGDDKINFAQVVDPDPAVWASLFEPGPLEHLLPLIVTAASVFLLVAGALQVSNQFQPPGSSRLILSLLALYWMPILMLAFLAGDTSTRYGLFLVPFGCVILSEGLVVAARFVWARLGSPDAAAKRGILLAAALAVVIVLHDVVGVAQVFQVAASGKRDLNASLRYVGDHRAPGDWVITVIPPPMTAYVLKNSENLAFLPGGEASTRAERYTRQGPDGQAIDYWLGVPSLATTGAFCSFIAAKPNSWLVIPRIYWESWGYRGGSESRTKRVAEELRAVVSGTSTPGLEDRTALVFQFKPTAAWSPEASDYCQKAVSRRERKSLFGS
jgi:hypothetical protein